MGGQQQRAGRRVALGEPAQLALEHRVRRGDRERARRRRAPVAAGRARAAAPRRCCRYARAGVRARRTAASRSASRSSRSARGRGIDERSRRRGRAERAAGLEHEVRAAARGAPARRRSARAAPSPAARRGWASPNGSRATASAASRTGAARSGKAAVLGVRARSDSSVPSAYASVTSASPPRSSRRRASPAGHGTLDRAGARSRWTPVRSGHGAPSANALAVERPVGRDRPTRDRRHERSSSIRVCEPVEPLGDGETHARRVYQARGGRLLPTWQPSLPPGRSSSRPPPHRPGCPRLPAGPQPPLRGVEDQAHGRRGRRLRQRHARGRPAGVPRPRDRDRRRDEARRHARAAREDRRSEAPLARAAHARPEPGRQGVPCPAAQEVQHRRQGRDRVHRESARQADRSDGHRLHRTDGRDGRDADRHHDGHQPQPVRRRHATWSPTTSAGTPSTSG